MTDLIKQSEELQKEGMSFLKNIRLIEELSKYGDPKIVGSMDSGLMTWRDIDIEIEKEELSENDYWQAVKFIFYLTNHYHNTFIQDFRGSKNPNTPKGLYIGAKIDYEGHEWKIDIWFFKPGDHQEPNYSNWIKGKLNNENRKVILEIKDQIFENPKYRKSIFSVDIYKAVIDENVKDFEGFEKYLTKSGRSLN